MCPEYRVTYVSGRTLSKFDDLSVSTAEVAHRSGPKWSQTCGIVPDSMIDN